MGKGGYNFAVYLPGRQLWLGATGGETAAGSAIRQQPMEITQKNPDDFERTAREWRWAYRFAPPAGGWLRVPRSDSRVR
jgi:hypothetical protein